LAPWHSLTARRLTPAELRATRAARPAVFLALSALALALLALTPRAWAAPAPVRVTIQDQPHFVSARSSQMQDGGFEVRADLRDDTGAPMAGAMVGVSALGASDERADMATCAEGRGARLRRGTPLRVDDAGSVCVRVTNAPPGAALALTFTGDALHLPAATRVALEPAPAGVELAFETPSIELPLDQPTLRLRLRVAGTAEREPIPAIELELHQQGRVVPLAASAWSRSGDALAFTLDTTQLGGPGPARLVARHAGAERLVRAEAVALKVSTVRLGGELSSADEPGSAAEIRVWAEPRGELAPSGWVEATRGEQGASLGSAPFEAGTALLRLAAEDASGDVWLYYRSDDPWWRAGEPLQLALGEPGIPRGPRRWPWLALLVPIGYVCMRSLQRPAPRQNERRGVASAAPTPAPLVVEAAAPLSGWVGTVSDAHDGRPVVGARVQVSLPSFREGDGARLSAFSDAQGGFRLGALPEPLPEGARLKVWAPLHSDIDRPLPPQGRVSIALTSRRRAVLRRLVRWARSLGPPWVRTGDPTPGEVAAIAARRGDGQTARWAEDVQAAAFGAALVDEAREAALRAAEPGWRANAPGERDTHDD
jgi:hypothetical protein